MGESLHDRAVRNFNFACNTLNHLTGDDFEINMVGYHLQQAVELALKHELEMNGISYPRTHSIDVLLNAIPAGVLTNDLYDRLYLAAGTLTVMESQTRYIKDYFLSIKQVELVKPLVEEVLNSTARCGATENIKPLKL